VEVLGKADNVATCCIRYKITVATQKGSNVNVDGTTASMKTGLTGSGNFIVEGEDGASTDKANSAATYGFSFLLLAAAFMALF